MEAPVIGGFFPLGSLYWKGALAIPLQTPQPLADPPLPTNLSADIAAFGPPVHPLDRLTLFSPSEWERFVEEWAVSLKTRYGKVFRAGGAGDQGRDIIAYDAQDPAIWDNFQCKRYDDALTPSDVCIELGKLLYYTWKGEYSAPRAYYFVAPRGAGTKLVNMMKKPEKLRKEVLDYWPARCEHEICHEAVPLTPELRAHIEKFDFSIFSAISPMVLIEVHRDTPYYVSRFGGMLKARPDPPEPPQTPTADETRYVTELLAAYGQHLGHAIADPSLLQVESETAKHFHNSRREFYSAESLRVFSRESLPETEYRRLQDEIHDGIHDAVNEPYPDGFARVKAAVRVARALQLTSHPLVPRLVQRDRGGICHQLANDGRVRWVR